MAHTKFTGITVSDRRSARYLLDRCKAIDALRNPLRHGTNPHFVARGAPNDRAGRFRSFPTFAGRWINNVKISAREWLRLVELYTNDEPVSRITAEVGVSYSTVLMAFETIRSAIASSPDNHEDAGTVAKKDSPVYGIRPSHGDGITFEEIAQDRILIKLDFRHAQLIFARKEMEYRSLWWSRNVLEIVDSGKLSLFYRIFSSDSDFWSFAKERLLKYHGVSFDKMPCYLDEIREIDFQWMNRGELLFDAVVERLCDYTPDSINSECS